ncbi:hypothetical protein RYX36_025113 [Vicia faba]
MLKRVVHSLGFVENTDKKDSRVKKKGGNKGYKGYKDHQFSSKSKDFVVRIAHPGGQQDVYRHAVPVYSLMTKYPGMCIASPDVFKLPHESVLWREDLLIPGHKYILISLKDVEKLKRRHPEKDQVKETNGVVEKEKLDTKSKSPSRYKHKEPNGGVEGMKLDTKMKEHVVEGEDLENSFRSANEFYNPKEKPTRPSRKRGLRPKKTFVPPFPKARHYRYGWKPSLPTVKELSP